MNSRVSDDFGPRLRRCATTRTRVSALHNQWCTQVVKDPENPSPTILRIAMSQGLSPMNPEFIFGVFCGG